MWEEKELGAARVLEELWLTEISLVRSPANLNARVHALKALQSNRFDELADGAIDLIRHHGWDAAAAGLTREEED